VKNMASKIIKISLALAVTSLVIGSLNAKDNVKLGEEVYSGTCIACHGENGRGEISGVPDLTLDNGPLAKTDTILLDHIINGFQSKGSDMAMPELGGNEDLTEQDIKNIIVYMRAKFQDKK